MKVAVLDLGTIFTRLFKPATSSSSTPTYPPATTAQPLKAQALLPPLVSPLALGAQSWPTRHTAILVSAGSSSVKRTAFPAGGGLGPGAVATKALASGSFENSSLQSAAGFSVRENGVWAAPASKQQLLVTLPEIGEEGAQEVAAQPRKGLSKGLTNHLFFQGKNGECLPAPFTKSVQEAIDNYTFVSVSSLSPSGETTPTDIQISNSWSGIQSCTTGASTERSSIYSWGDDEFETINKQRVHQLFWNVDEMLFEGEVSSQTENLKEECKDWTNRSLHLRILGKQLLFPTDEGFQHYHSSTASSVCCKSLPTLREITSNMKDLCILGSKVVPATFPVCKAFINESSLADSTGYSFLQEEIYDAEGEIEEYLAFDNKELDDEDLAQSNSQLAPQKIKHGIPPVSPCACIKEAVAAEVFDKMWKMLIKLLQDLIRKYQETSIIENDQQMEKPKITGNKFSHISTACPVLDMSSVPPSRGSEVRSSSFVFQFGPSKIHHFPSNLNGVMTIQAKPLQQRHSSLSEKIQRESDDKPQGVGSSVYSARNRLGQISDSSVFSGSRILPGSSKKAVGHHRLPSLAAEQLRTKSPNIYGDEVLRGTKLCTTLDCLSSSFMPGARNKLPPISSDAIDQYLLVPGFRLNLHRGRHPHSRISSAVADGLEQRPHREQPVVTDHFSRPSTTHTFQSDTPHKRSLISIDLANHMWTSQGVVAGSQFHARSLQKNPPVSRRRFQLV